MELKPKKATKEDKKELFVEWAVDITTRTLKELHGLKYHYQFLPNAGDRKWDDALEAIGKIANSDLHSCCEMPTIEKWPKAYIELADQIGEQVKLVQAFLLKKKTKKDVVINNELSVLVGLTKSVSEYVYLSIRAIRVREYNDTL